MLDLSWTRVTDRGFEHLRGLTQLEDLRVIGSKVADAGLEHLKRLTQLQELDLYDTDATDAGVKKLQQALPTCKIEH